MIRYSKCTSVAAVMILIPTVMGCGPTSTKQENAARGSGPTVPGSGGAVQAVRGAVKRTVDLTTLNGIAQLYNSFSLDRGKSPASQKEFLDYIRRDDRKGAAAIEDGSIILVVGAKLDSNAILAYAAEPSTFNTRAVAIGTGAQSIPEEDFQSKAKAQGIEVGKQQ